MKQAYLIIAHNKLEQLKFLISLLDYESHDIFILFDKKSKISNQEKVEIRNSVKKSEIIFTKEIPIYWGDYSQIEAELELFETAQKHEEYSMYHLLSGVDLPLETAENIYKFFDENKEYNFLDLDSEELLHNKNYLDRVKYYYLSMSKINKRITNNLLLQVIYQLYRGVELYLQKIIGLNRIKKYKFDFKKGSNWCSLNKDTVKIIISEKSFIEILFKKTKAGDEIFIPTIISKNNLLDTVYIRKDLGDNLKTTQGNFRYINWEKGNPYTWTDSEDDVKEIMDAKHRKYLFSRKFDLDKYPNMQEKIFDIIKEKV